MLTLQNLTKHYKGTDLKADPLGCKSKIAYIPDNPDIYEYLTGIQFLHFIADVFQVSAVDRDEHIRKYADAFEKYHAGNQ